MAFHIFQAMGPFSLYIRHVCEPDAYNELYIKSVRLTTADGCEYPFEADAFPIKRDFEMCMFLKSGIDKIGPYHFE